MIVLNRNDFSCIEYFLFKFKTLRLLLADCNIKKEDDQLIYAILAKLGSAYLVFVSSFHSTREAIICSGGTYKMPSFELFCDSLVREQDKLLHLGVISTARTSGKALVTQPKEGSKNPQKPKSHHNKHTKGTKPSQLAPTPNGEKSTKAKDKKTVRHCNYCGRDNHVESKCFKKMAALEEAMKRNNISLDTPSNSSSHGHALSASGFSFNASSTATANEWLNDCGASY